jgi:hypothetical protein
VHLVILFLPTAAGKNILLKTGAKPRSGNPPASGIYLLQNRTGRTFGVQPVLSNI